MNGKVNEKELRLYFMNTGKANMQYEVLNPWAEVDPKPLRGISPRLAGLKDKTIGLFYNRKPAGLPIQTVVESRLKERFPDLRFIPFKFPFNRDVIDTEYEESYRLMLKEVDAVVSAVGD